MRFNNIESGKTYKSSSDCLYYVRTVVDLINGGKRVYCDGMNGEHLGSIPESIWSTFTPCNDPREVVSSEMEHTTGNATGVLFFNLDDHEGQKKFQRASQADDLFRAVSNIQEELRRKVKYENKEAIQEARDVVVDCLSDAGIDFDNLYC